MTTFIAFAVILVSLVVFHELGHFIAAKLSGIKVHEFGIGYPPRLFGFRFGETLYSINLLPLGGFVKLAGEEDPRELRSFAGKGVLTRFIVLTAGSFMNVLLPVVLFTVLFMVPRQEFVGLVQINEVRPDSPAQRVGLQPKDIIMKVDGNEIRNIGDLQYRIHLRLGAESNWEVKRGPEVTKITVVPRWRTPPDQGPTGITVGMIASYWDRVSVPFWKAIPASFQRLGEVIILAKNEVTRWFVGGSRPALAGPVGIYQITGEVARAGGFLPLLEFAALLSVSLAILNVLPIPMLDGGRLLFVAIEWVRRGKRIPPEKESLVHLVGFAMIIAVAVIVTYFDVLRLVRGESFIR